MCARKEGCDVLKRDEWSGRVVRLFCCQGEAMKVLLMLVNGCSSSVESIV